MSFFAQLAETDSSGAGSAIFGGGMLIVILLITIATFVLWICRCRPAQIFSFCERKNTLGVGHHLLGIHWGDYLPSSSAAAAP